MQSFPRFFRYARAALSTALIVLAGAAVASDPSDNNAEREALAALTRQIDLANRLADQAAAASSDEHARYHFDYARLREDLHRVHAGVEDYLAPQRAQPRDPVPLSGSYVRETGSPTSPTPASEPRVRQP